MTRHQFGDLATAEPPAPAPLVELPVERYLVSWDRAHAQGLALEMPGWFHHHDRLAHPPREEHFMGVVVMRVRAILRKTHEEDVEISPDAVENMRWAMPATDPEHSREYRILLSTGDLRPCSFCGVTPGKQLCANCGGSGQVWRENGDGDGWVTCRTCAGAGSETCGACGGRLTVLPARVRFVSDESTDLKYTLVPDALAALHDPIDEYLDQIATFPKALLLDSEQSGGYRTRDPMEFHGYALEKAVAHARETANALGEQPGVVAQHVTSWVVPVALLDYKDRAVALVAAPDGSVVAV